MVSAEYLREWRRKNPEKLAEYAQRHRESNILSIRQWRRANPDQRNNQRKKNYNQTGNACKSHKRWNQNHDILVLERSCSDRELHELIGRSVQAIQIRRHNLKYGVVSTSGISKHLLTP
jgi:hypothetical protein